MRSKPETIANVSVKEYCFSKKQIQGVVEASQFKWTFTYSFNKGLLKVNPPLGRALIENALLKFLSTFVHLGIYFILFAIPITGLLAYSTGNIDLGIAHKILVNILYLFIITHLIGVAYHQIFLGDNIMQRITSWKS